jgi:hypothetical protein
VSFATRTWVTGEIVTAAIGNAQWRDNLNYLYGSSGDVTLYGTANLILGGNYRAESGAFRIHRHPYANERHLESGTVLITTGSSVASSASASFTNAFAATPVVMATAQWAGAGGASSNVPVAAVSSVSTTGCTVWGGPGNGWTNQPVAWLAEGQD